MQMSNKVKVVPCSGIGKVFGLVAREAVLKAVLELCPEKSETVCLAYLVTGDEEVKEMMSGSVCITVDGCPKMCASKNVSLSGGIVVDEVKVLDTVKDYKGKKFGSATELSDDGYLVADEIAAKIEQRIHEIL
ncbi:MAG: hypothetical protein EOM90_15390 [Alphaproteobacteria bacterium]|nr:hypothetical protein [Alphaproteobacteria bacterium]